MGGSESRCCVDSEEKQLEENGAVYASVSQSGEKLAFSGTRLLQADPRSPSSLVDRTPIRVHGTPTLHPKPLMRVHPMVENSCEKNAQEIGYQGGSALVDPRSPVPYGSRTPIMLPSKHKDAIIDPRSPSEGVLRTPLVAESSAELLYGDPEKNQDCDDSRNWVICQTPKKTVYAMKEEIANDVIPGIFDPRSPSEGIERTPVRKHQTSDEIPSSLSSDLQPVTTEELCSDPRSPSEQIPRTPIANLQKQDEEVACVASKCLGDPRSPISDVSRTPLSAIFSGHRELRRTVLMTNALMASPLTKKINSSNGDTSQFIMQSHTAPSSCASQNFLDIPVGNLERRSFNESCSSSLVALIGSDVDCMNLDDSVDDYQQSVNSIDDIEIDQDKDVVDSRNPQRENEVTAAAEQDSDGTLPYQGQFVVHNTEHVGDNGTNQDHKDPTLITTTLASGVGSSVDADIKFVTAKFSLQSTDEEYQSAPEFPNPTNLVEDSEDFNIDTSCTPAKAEGKSVNTNMAACDFILDCVDKGDSSFHEQYQMCSSAKTSQEISTAESAAADVDCHNMVNENKCSESSAEMSLTSEADKEVVMNAADRYSSEDSTHLTSQDLVSEDTSKNMELSECFAGSSKVSVASSKSSVMQDECKKTPVMERRKKPKRRLRTPKAVSYKQRQISTPSELLSTTSVGDFKMTKTKSLSNSQLAHAGLSLSRNKNAQTLSMASAEKSTGTSPAPRSPFAVLTNDSSKSCDGKSRKILNKTNLATKLPRYRAVASKTASRALSSTFRSQTAIQKNAAIGNKEN